MCIATRNMYRVQSYCFLACGDQIGALKKKECLTKSQTQCRHQNHYRLLLFFMTSFLKCYYEQEQDDATNESDAEQEQDDATNDAASLLTELNDILLEQFKICR